MTATPEIALAAVQFARSRPWMQSRVQAQSRVNRGGEGLAAGELGSPPASGAADNAVGEPQ